LGVRKGEVVASDVEGAQAAARTRWHTKAGTPIEVKPKFPLAREIEGEEDYANIGPSTAHDAHVIKVALAILEWPRERLRSRVSGVRNADLENLLRGCSSGAVKARVFKVLREAGCNPEEISELVIRAKGEGAREKDTESS